MNFNTKVSIIISVLNSENVLEQCLKSVFNQTYKNIELIIIDGKSTDDTLKIIKKYSKFITYWISEKDSGIYDAWNKAIPKATGDWLCFIGSDDILDKDAIYNYVDILKPNINFICSRVRLVNEYGEEVGIIGKSWNYDHFKRGLGIVHCGAFHHKELFNCDNFFDVSYKIAGDFEFLIRVGKNVKPLFLKKITVNMFIGGTSRRNITRVIYETSRALCLNRNFGILHGLNYFIIAHLKSYIRTILLSFTIGKKFFQINNSI